MDKQLGEAAILGIKPAVGLSYLCDAQVQGSGYELLQEKHKMVARIELLMNRKAFRAQTQFTSVVFKMALRIKTDKRETKLEMSAIK